MYFWLPGPACLTHGEMSWDARVWPASAGSWASDSLTRSPSRIESRIEIQAVTRRNGVR